MTKKGINAVDIEKSTGLSRNTIYSIISGASKNPSAYNLQLIAKALDVSLESILTAPADIQLDTLSPAQMKALSEATDVTVNAVIERKLDFSYEKLTSLIKEVYQYTIKTDPPCVDSRFINWLLDKCKY